MREILFRGKGFNGEWEYGVPVFSGLNNELAFMKQMHSYDHQVIPETVGQYTGLTDKNGKKIFEGDIIIFNRGRNLPNTTPIPLVVYYDEENVQFTRYKSPYATLQKCMMSECEVIGNIHDNPELLTGGAE